MKSRGNVLFAGCKPEVAAGPDGHILAVGPRARDEAGRGAEVVRLRGEAWPGLVDSHIHLEGLAERRLIVDLTGSRSKDEVLRRVARRAKATARGGWVVGAGWDNDLWPDRSFPSRVELDRSAGGRPVFLRRKDGHSAWASSEALRRSGVDRTTPDPPGGVIDRDDRREPTGILRESAMSLVDDQIPEPGAAELDVAMAQVLRSLARLGLTAVHTMDGASQFASLQRLHAKRRLPIRVSYNLPLSDLPHAERMGVRSGWGDGWLRIWGVKAFLDGSLGSRTAEMLDGSGTARLIDQDLNEMIRRCIHAELNVCLHAIGDGAVRRALNALEPHRGAWSRWRPRIEHAQCVHVDDMPRFGRIGVIASMQPIHAAADRELADQYWPSRTADAYAWRALERAGARLAFGSDAPVETADPRAGIEAATAWRRKARWHPELALTRASAMRAYTAGAAYAAGMEDMVGALRPGLQADLTVVDAGRVVAAVVGGRVSWRRRT
jgi:predicted amidohydrolase YtcJ